MANGEISVVFGDVEDMAGRVRQACTNIDMQLSDLKTMLGPIVEAWTGAAATAYQVRQNAWNNAAADLHAVLIQIASVLQNSHGAYVETESSVQQLWGS